MISTDSIAPGRFCYYGFRVSTTQHLLPLGVELVIDRFCGYSMLLAYSRMNNQVITACQFTEEEVPMLLLLCEYWPSMVTHELLVMTLYPMPAVPIVAHQIEDARNAGTLEHLIVPLRQQVDGYRKRLSELGLDVREVEGYGYRLIQAQGTPNGGCEDEVMP